MSSNIGIAVFILLGVLLVGLKLFGRKYLNKDFFRQQKLVLVGIVLLLVLGVFLFFLLSNKETKKCTIERQENMAFEGNVKSVFQEDYFAKDSMGIVTPKARANTENFIAYFNENREIETYKEFNLDYEQNTLWLMVEEKYNYSNENKVVISIVIYDASGSELKHMQHIKKYDSKGDLLEFLISNEEFFSKIVYKYGDNKNIKDESTYGKDGNLSRRTIYEYDRQGRKAKVRHRTKEGIIRQVFEYQYSNNWVNEFYYVPNKEGELILQKEEKFNEAGLKIENSNSTYTQYYEYSKGGDLIKTKTVYKSDNSIIEGYNTYEFDNEGNWIKRIIYLDNSPQYLTVRKIEYYN